MKELMKALLMPMVLGLSMLTLVATAQTTGEKTAAPGKAVASDLEEVVVAAQKLREGSIGGWLQVPLPELPRTVTVIDEEMISKQFVSHTKDILKNVPGVQIMPDNNLAGYQTPYIRGIQSSQYFEGQYSAGVVSSMPDIIGGAEVLQGFNSLQFAIDTGGGSVNYFMKRPKAQDFVTTELRVSNWSGAKLVVDANRQMGPGETDGVRFVGVIDRDQSYVRDFHVKRAMPLRSLGGTPASWAFRSTWISRRGISTMTPTINSSPSARRLSVRLRLSIPVPTIRRAGRRRLIERVISSVCA